MEYPILNVKQKSRQMTDAFLGYNHNLRIGENEFYDMQNMTSDYYPVLAPRKARGRFKDVQGASGLIAKEELCYTEEDKFIIGGEMINMELSSDKNKRLVSMGSYVIILPDKKWINTVADKNGKYEWENIEHEVAIDTSENIATFLLCDSSGKVYTDAEVRPGEKPVEADGNLWLDTDSTPPVLKRYSANNGYWMVVPDTYVKITAGNGNVSVGEKFAPGDGVEISGITNSAYSNLNGIHTVKACDDKYIVIDGMPNFVDYQNDEVEGEGVFKITRKMPEMDFIIESNNRLWGCRYGLNSRGEFVNEIYASKLGDFKNWNCYMGISTDSYAASCGTDGPFTGAINYLGYPLFFKENCVHKVYGDYPANFQIQDTACRGVQKGCHDSLAIVNETLFYKSLNGVCAYDGSLPVEMSSALGEVRYSDAVACGVGSKYYIDMKSADGVYNLFVYDMEKGMWHKEDNLQVLAMCNYNGNIYAVTPGEDGKNIISMLLGSSDSAETFNWMAESGLIGMNSPDMKYISKLVVRMAMAEGARVEFSIQYDSTGVWEKVWEWESDRLRSLSIPIRPKRCDHFRLRIEGEGDARIYSITKTIEQGSDVS